MDGTCVLLLRHGEIPQAEPRRFVGQRDLPLSDKGRRQAKAWALVLAKLPIAGAWCSDLARCRETAALALAQTGLAATPLSGLREISLGRWEGLTTEEVRQRFPEEFTRRGADLAGVAPSGGESFLEAQERAWAALQGVVTRHSGLLLVVAHAGVNRALICRVLGLPVGELFKLGQDYCGLNILEFPQSGPARLAALNIAVGGGLPGALAELAHPGRDG